jgi:FkbM family methyltransferase
MIVGAAKLRALFGFRGARFWLRLRKLAVILPDARLRAALAAGAAVAAEHLSLLSDLRPASVVDVGANVGQFTLAVRHILPQIPVIAFEPLARPAGIFAKLFGKDPQIRLERIALGAETRRASMVVTAADDSSSLLPVGAEQLRIFPGTQAVGTAAVEVDRLDRRVTAAELRAPALLKIDVQGYELEVLRGAEGVLGAFEHVYVEASFRQLYVGQALAEAVIDHLTARDFALERVCNPTTDRDGSMVQADLLFSRPKAHHSLAAEGIGG